MAFQKVNRLKPDSVVGAATWSALRSPVRPTARSRAGLVIEIHRSRQVLLRVRDGRAMDWLFNRAPIGTRVWVY